MEAAQNRNAAAKQQFIKAVGEDTSTINAYISRCEHIELALGEYEPTLREADGQFAQFADLAPNVKLQTQAQFFRKVVGIDLQSVQVFRREISLAKRLPNMPTGKQRLFYQSSIVPIQMEEDRLAEEEIEIIKDAKGSGIPFLIRRSHSPANAAHASARPRRALRPPGNASLPPTVKHVVSRFAFLLRPAALPALTSALPLRLFFSASAKMKEKINPRKRDRRNHHENDHEFNPQHIQQERKQSATEILQQQSGDPDRESRQRCGFLWRQ
jgi:hypothetical protein